MMRPVVHFSLFTAMLSILAANAAASEDYFPPAESAGGCGNSTHGLAHASPVRESVTGQLYDEFAIEALFQPLGIEHWTFQYYEGGEKHGRHPSHGLGISARALARIGYCIQQDARWAVGEYSADPPMVRRTIGCADT